MKRRTLLKRSLLASPLVAGLGAGYARFIERHALQTVSLTISVGMGDPLTVAVLGDFHFDPLYETDYLAEVIALTNSLNPDLILFTGDFVSDSTECLGELVEILGKAKAKFGCFTVLGNHDHWIGADEIESGLASAGINVLRNQSVSLANRSNWYLTGLESYWSGRPNVKSIESTPTHSRHLLLLHEPDAFDLMTDSRIALQLSGHTHGGQVRMPFLGPICLPSWGKKYPAGLYVRGNRPLYVNRGIGTVKRHFRMNCRPEITLLILT